jgi:putative ABC transport system permease protein
MFGRSPWSTFGIVLTLALGTGFNSAVLAVAYGILIRPLPYHDPGRLVIIRQEVLFTEVDEWRARLRTVDGVAGFASADHSLRGIGEPRIVRTAFVSSEFFSVLGATPASGRAFEAASGVDGIVVSERLASVSGISTWELLDSQVSIADGAFTVLGVMPASVSIPSESIDVWVPAAAAPAIPVLRKDDRRYSLLARLKPGVTLEQAGEDAARVAREVAPADATKSGGPPPTIVSIEAELLGAARPVLLALATGAAMVLLVTCANVASLLLGRAVSRERETAVLLALGAPTKRIIATFFAEGLLLALAGSASGIVIAVAAVRVLRTQASALLPRLEAVRIDLPVLTMTLVVAIVVAILCTAGPGLHSLKRGSTPVVRPGGRSNQIHQTRMTAALVVAQIALSVVVLVAGGLLARTVARLLAVDTGVDPKHALTLKLMLGERSLLRPGERQQFVRALIEQLQVLPGVRTVGIGSSLPPQTSQVEIGIRVVEGGRDASQRMGLVAMIGDYLGALGARFVAGRSPGSGALGPASPAVVLSRSAAAHLFAERDPVGQEISPVPGSGGKRPRVLGVIDDVKYTGLAAPVRGAIYVPWEQFPIGAVYLVVRANQDPMALAPAVRAIVHRLDPGQPISEVRSLEDAVSGSVADRRLHALLASAFALLALAVSLLGLSAALGRRIADRRHELAIRSALGATPSDTVRLVMGYGVRLACLGVGIGLLLAIVAARGLAARLFGVTVLDPMTYLTVATVTSLIAFLTCLVPAYRAASMDPGALLRAD